MRSGDFSFVLLLCFINYQLKTNRLLFLLMKYALIVAGGSGSRMSSDIPKQFLEIAGLPILMHTIRRFYEYSPTVKIIVVLPADQLIAWENLREKHQFQIPLQSVIGGKTRFQSVKNGLASIEDEEGEVAIHDGVRPLVSVEVIKKSFETARERGSAVAAVALKDSIRRVVSDYSTQSVNRSHFRLVQTPQTFQINLIKAAFQQPESENFTDDATVLESAGGVICLIAGDYLNIKITTKDDLSWAEFYIREILKKA